MESSSCRSWIVGLSAVTALGCTHLDSERARLGSTVAGASVGAATTTLASDVSAVPEGLVDLSEPPRVIDEARSASGATGRFQPGVLLAAPEPFSWLAADFTGERVEIELRNSCHSSFGYSFSVSAAAADAAHPRRTLAGHTLETQRIPKGHWLHLWDGDRWIGSAMTTVEDGRMDISPTCDTLEVSFALADQGPTSFAIHLELDAEDGLAGASTSEAGERTITVEAQDQLESWGPNTDVDADRVELRLTNFCPEVVEYGFVAGLDAEPDRTASLAGRSERRVEIPVGWWLRYQALEDGWRGGATTLLDGGVVWIAADCVDFGVADGQVVGPIF